MTDIQKYDSNPAPMAAASTTETDGTRALQNLEAQAQAMGNAMKIAEAMCSTAMVPKQFQGKPADGAAAILYGAELGLNAIQSLQQIMVINGKPGIETRTAVALLKNQGYEIRTVESSDESVTVEGVGPRGEHEVSTWDMKRATTAGYTSNSLYKKIPAQMLYSKAAMEVARKIAPHVLSGIGYSTEELRLDAVNMTAARRDDSRGVSQVRAALAAKKKEHPEPQAEEDQFVKDVKVALAELTTPEDVTSFMQEIRQDSNVPEVVIDLGRQRWNELQEEEK
ncbi:hypothetical protein [Corynebacterium sp. 11254D000AR]